MRNHKSGQSKIHLEGEAGRVLVDSTAQLKWDGDGMESMHRELGRHDARLELE